MKLAEVIDAHPSTVRIELYENIREALTQALSETLTRFTSRENLEQLLAQLGKKGLSDAAGRARCPQPIAIPEVLTARELEILKRIAGGESNKSIARALDLSVHTVKRHVANILGKLGVNSRIQAATWLSAHH